MTADDDAPTTMMIRLLERMYYVVSLSVEKNEIRVVSLVSSFRSYPAMKNTWKRGDESCLHIRFVTFTDGVRRPSVRTSVDQF